ERVLECLACAGAFDGIEKERARALAAVETVLSVAQRSHEAASMGQIALFGGGARRAALVERGAVSGGAGGGGARRAPPPGPAGLPAERLQREYDAVGFFLTGHP